MWLNWSYGMIFFSDPWFGEAENGIILCNRRCNCWQRFTSVKKGVIFSFSYGTCFLVLFFWFFSRASGSIFQSQYFFLRAVDVFVIFRSGDYDIWRLYRDWMLFWVIQQLYLTVQQLVRVEKVIQDEKLTRG